MNLPDPTILLAITPHSMHLTRTDRHASYDSIGLQLATLGKEGYMGAAYKLGDTAMRMLADAHPQIFAAHPALMPPTAGSSPAAMALGLIKLSEKHNTRVFVPAIDALLQLHADAITHPGLATTWHAVRQRLMGILG